MDAGILDKEINNLKEALYTLMTYNKLTDSNVVECSKRLDRLIVQYQKHETFC